MSDVLVIVPALDEAAKEIEGDGIRRTVRTQPALAHPTLSGHRCQSARW